MTFNYTRGTTDINSSVVDEAYYDATSRRLAVVLDSGYGYVYSDVPETLYFRLTSGTTSVGRVYNSEIKRRFNSEHLGYVGHDSSLFEKGYVAPSMASVGAPQAWTTSPKSVTTASGNVFLSGDGSASFVNLASDEDATPERVLSKHTVKFTVEGGNEVKTYNVEAGSWTEAMWTLEEAAKALGINVKVREVTVYFE